MNRDFIKKVLLASVLVSGLSMSAHAAFSDVEIVERFNTNKPTWARSLVLDDLKEEVGSSQFQAWRVFANLGKKNTPESLALLNFLWTRNSGELTTLLGARWMTPDERSKVETSELAIVNQTYQTGARAILASLKNPDHTTAWVGLKQCGLTLSRPVFEESREASDVIEDILLPTVWSEILEAFTSIQLKKTVGALISSGASDSSPQSLRRNLFSSSPVKDFLVEAATLENMTAVATVVILGALVVRRVFFPTEK